MQKLKIQLIVKDFQFINISAFYFFKTYFNTFNL